MSRNTLILSCLIIIIIFLSACSSTPSWPAEKNKDPLILIGPLYDAEIEKNYYYSSLLRKTINDLLNSQKSNNPTPNHLSYIPIKSIDWVLYRKENILLWRKILQEVRFGNNFYDNFKLAEILKDDPHHQVPFVLALHIVPPKEELPENLLIEGYRFYRKGDIVEANWFQTSISIQGKEPLNEIKKTILLLINQNNFASPGFDNMGFVSIEGGCFMMGDQFRSGDIDERPLHEECISSFLLGKYPVTQSQWQSVMGFNPSLGTINGYHPVENVSWNETQLFLERLNHRSQSSYRLPTETEWEYACRNAGEKIKYPVKQGGQPDLDQFQANLNGALHNDQWDNTSPVGSFPANQLGIFDMAGNVWEWTEDTYFKYAYRGMTPMFKGRENKRVTRGGSFDSEAAEARCSMRGFSGKHIRSGDIGFRLIKNE